MNRLIEQSRIGVEGDSLLNIRNSRNLCTYKKRIPQNVHWSKILRNNQKHTFQLHRSTLHRSGIFNFTIIRPLNELSNLVIIFKISQLCSKHRTRNRLVKQSEQQTQSQWNWKLSPWWHDDVQVMSSFCTT